MKIRIPSVLRSYTNDQKHINIDGRSVLEVLNNLNIKFPGIKFRFIDEHNNIRPHMNIFLNENRIKTLDIEVNDDDELFIAQSLSGG